MTLVVILYVAFIICLRLPFLQYSVPLHYHLINIAVHISLTCPNFGKKCMILPGTNRHEQAQKACLECINSSGDVLMTGATVAGASIADLPSTAAFFDTF